MEEHNFTNLKERLKKLFGDVIFHNQVDTSIMTEDAVWYANAELLHLEKGEAQYYLQHTLMSGADAEPEIQFADASYIGAECISIIGSLAWSSTSQRTAFYKVIFQTNWQLCGKEWKLRQLITNRSKEIVEERTAGSQTNEMNDRKLLQQFPTGLICCTGEEYLPIRRMNEKLLTNLGYLSVKDYQDFSGKLLMTSVHPEDIPRFRTYIQHLQDGEDVEDICIRLRKKDYTYLPVQIFGGTLGNSWLVFACVDYSEQQERMDNLKEKSQKLANLRDDYRVLVENLPSGFHRCALHDPVHVDYVSDNFCQLTGYSQKDIFETMHSIYLEMVVPEDRHLIVDGLTALMQYPHTVQTIYRLQRKDGSVIRVLDRMRSVRHTDGKMWGYSIVVDLDEHPLQAAETAKSELPQTDFPRTDHAHSVEIHTFGYFEILVDRKPIAFRSAKARELLAVLVDRRGNFTSREAIISMLWENETVNPTTLARCRKTFMNLMTELREYGIEDILETQNGQRRIIPEKVQCDLFAYFKGDAKAVQLFRGEYMNEYSWSEMTLSSLMPDEF